MKMENGKIMSNTRYARINKILYIFKMFKYMDGPTLLTGNIHGDPMGSLSHLICLILNQFASFTNSYICLNNLFVGQL